jgi:hypothetical protein
MRKVESSATIRKSARSLWRVLRDMRNWETLSESFAGWGFKFRYAITKGPKDGLTEGSEIAVTDEKGHSIMNCRVTLWDPPRRLELAAQSDSGFMKSYRMLFTVYLSALDDDLTNAELSFVVMFGNRFIETFSLLMPVRFLYRRRLDAVLDKMRESAD